MQAANNTEAEEVEFIRAGIELAKIGRDFIRDQMACGERPVDFAELRRWNSDIHALEQHLAAI